MSDATETGEAADPPDLPTTLAEQINELHFATEDDAGEGTFEELCHQHPDWASAMREYREAMVAGERILGRATGGMADASVAQPPLPDRIGPYRILERLGEG